MAVQWQADLENKIKPTPERRDIKYTSMNNVQYNIRAPHIMNTVVNLQKGWGQSYYAKYMEVVAARSKEWKPDNPFLNWDSNSALSEY